MEDPGRRGVPLTGEKYINGAIFDWYIECIIHGARILKFLQISDIFLLSS